MKINKLLSKLAPLTLCIALVTGCSGATTNATSQTTTSTSQEAVSNQQTTNTTGTSNVVATTYATGSSEVEVSYDEDDYGIDWQNQTHETIALNGESVTITESGIYEITGTLSEGSITINVDKSVDKGTVYLVLNNAHITSETTAPINIVEGKKVVLMLPEGTQNTISQGSNITDEEVSAAIYSKADLTITGAGTLQVTTAFNDGITSKDDLKITGGTLIIDAAMDGLVGKDLLAVEDGNITINAGKDGMRATNDTDEGRGNVVISGGAFAITSGNDGIQAERILQIDGGEFDITTGGGYSEATAKTGNMSGGMKDPGQMRVPGEKPTGTQSDASNQTQGLSGASTEAQANQPPTPPTSEVPTSQVATTTTTTETTESDSQKGLKATEQIIINGGNYTISSAEDTVHSNGSIVINDGKMVLTSGDDGVHADGDLTVNNGEITVTQSYEGLEGSNITINNGMISLVTSDDGINVNQSQGIMTINGGEVYVNASGDGLDSNRNIQMSGGLVIVEGPTNSGNGALDYDGNFNIDGGTLVALGSSGMAQAPQGESTQASLMMYYSSVQAEDTPIVLKDSSGNVVVNYTPSKQYQSVCISAPQLKVGETYTLYSGETKVVDATLSGSVTYFSETGETTGMQGGFGGGSKPSGGRGGEKPQPMN